MSLECAARPAENPAAVPGPEARPSPARAWSHDGDPTVKLRLPLRWRIVLFSAPLLAALALASAWMVSRGIESQVHQRLHEDLRRAAAVFEDILAERSTELRIAGAVTVHDPRFFASLALPAPPIDPMDRATVEGVARDFHSIARTDLFEVFSTDGALVASVGRARSPGAAGDSLVREALAGRVADGVVGQEGTHFQAVVTPVSARGRVVGALLLGSEIGPALAQRLRALTRCEVTFASGGRATGSTLEKPEDLAAALAAVLAAEDARGTAPDGHGEVFERAGAETWLTRVGALPHAAPGAREYYVVQRSWEAETAFLRDIHRRLALLGSFGALLALIAGFGIAASITAPVQHLVRAAAEMERGNYGFPLDAHDRDEIGWLATRFERMREHQRERIDGLQEATRLKSEFIAVASHELRTPVSVIGGFQQLLRDGSLGPVTPGQVQALDAIGRSCASLARLAEDATRMAQFEAARDALALAEADLAAVLEAAVREAREVAPNRRVELSLRIEPGLTHVHADAERLQHAVSQLVRNGIRFTPDGGRVEVEAVREPDSVAVHVRDTGVGMSEEQRRSLFDRGVVMRDSPNHHSSNPLEFNSAGLGLGLALARGVAEAHGGELRVESAPGVGSTFTLVLPLAAGRERAA